MSYDPVRRVWGQVMGALLRTTGTSYLALNNSTYLANNLLSLPASVQIKNGSGTQVAYTTYGYDGTGSTQCFAETKRQLVAG